MYTEVITKIGVAISSSKCTSSKQGFAEFAKRLFSPKGEVTGLPVHLLSGLKSSPEQLLELLRICRSRGYKDDSLNPCFLTLLNEPSLKKHRTLVTSIFSLPECVAGVPPLFKEGDAETNTINTKLNDISTDDLLSALQVAREYLFWKTVEGLKSQQQRNSARAIDVQNNHPLVFALHAQAEKFLPEEAYQKISDTGEVEYLDEPDDYYIHSQWMKGDYQYLASIPSIDTYKYYNKGHKVTKCKFDVFSTLVKLINGDCNIPLHYREVYTNQDLYDLTIDSITPIKKGKK
jgi:hypothetical protein